MSRYCFSLARLRSHIVGVWFRGHIAGLCRRRIPQILIECMVQPLWSRQPKSLRLKGVPASAGGSLSSVQSLRLTFSLNNCSSLGLRIRTRRYCEPRLRSISTQFCG